MKGLRTTCASAASTTSRGWSVCSAAQSRNDEQYQRTLEHFKTFFARLGDAVDSWSSSASWAETDLLSLMQDATANAPLFIEVFYDGWEVSRNQGLDVPDTDVMNDVLAKHGVPFRIEPPDLKPVGVNFNRKLRTSDNRKLHTSRERSATGFADLPQQFRGGARRMARCYLSFLLAEHERLAAGPT